MAAVARRLQRLFSAQHLDPVFAGRARSVPSFRQHAERLRDLAHAGQQVGAFGHRFDSSGRPAGGRRVDGRFRSRARIARHFDHQVGVAPLAGDVARETLQRDRDAVISIAPATRAWIVHRDIARIREHASADPVEPARRAFPALRRIASRRGVRGQPLDAPRAVRGPGDPVQAISGCAIRRDPHFGAPAFGQVGMGAAIDQAVGEGAAADHRDVGAIAHQPLLRRRHGGQRRQPVVVE